jgi:hypothetical protein
MVAFALVFVSFNSFAGNAYLDISCGLKMKATGKPTAGDFPDELYQKFNLSLSKSCQSAIKGCSLDFADSVIVCTAMRELPTQVSGVAQITRNTITEDCSASIEVRLPDGCMKNSVLPNSARPTRSRGGAR